MQGFTGRLAMIAAVIAAFFSLSIPSATRAQTSDGTLIAGRYTSNWGNAHAIRGPGPEQARIEFDDGSVISGQFVGGPNGRFIGTYLRARGTAGRVPTNMRVLSACDRRAPVIPVGFRDPETPYWGTVRLTFHGDGNTISGHMVRCALLPHNMRAERDVFIAHLEEADRDAPSPLRRAPLRRLGSNRAATQLFLATRNPCAGSASAAAEPKDCVVDGTTTPLILLLRQPLPPGRQTVYLQPLRSDFDALMAYIRGDGPRPLRLTVPEIHYPIPLPRGGATGDRLPIRWDPRFCQSDLWDIRLQDGRGGWHDRIGVIQATCGPHDGFLADGAAPPVPDGPIKK